MERVERDEDLRSSMYEKEDAVIEFKIKVVNRSRMILIKCQLFVLQVQGAQQRIFVFGRYRREEVWDGGCMVQAMCFQAQHSLRPDKKCL